VVTRANAGPAGRLLGCADLDGRPSSALVPPSSELVK